MILIFINLAIKTDCDPFLRDQEPRDLYRNIDQIQMIDIQYYNQFMSTNCNEDESIKVSMIQQCVAIISQKFLK